ncbi:MAG: RNA polymerase sigma factor [Gemmataceae bacterium]|nr:RNA polymerase sigma factor [Gemmataceae bacterium]
MIEVIPIGNAVVSDTDDARDIAAAISGDGEAYRRLVGRYQSEVAQQMRWFSRDSAVRDELTHDVFVEAYLSLRSYRGTAPWIHWLRKIAVRVGYRYWTSRQGRTCEVALSEDDWQRLRGKVPEPTEATAAADLVYALLAQLASSDRLILTLLYLDGCTMAEAAERAGWTVVGTKVRAFRARNRLRKLIEGGSDET